jgi:hypothetical protein
MICSARKKIHAGFIHLMRIKAAIELDPKNVPMNEALALPAVGAGATQD